MASNPERAEPTTESRSEAQDIPIPPNRAEEELPAPTPVEMSNLSTQSESAQPETSTPPPAPSIPPQEEAPKPHPGPVRTDTTTALHDASHPPSSPPPVTTSTRMTRAYSTAIGPSSDQPIVPTKDVEGSGPTLVITLLLTSGARHPFKLDNKYLTKRNVDVTGNDPFNLSVYKLKELILREWREEWEAKPSSPNYIRLISFGKLLDDKTPLKDLKFNQETPNVVHMTIKPQDYVEEEDTKGGKAPYSASGQNEGRSPGCRCMVM